LNGRAWYLAIDGDNASFNSISSDAMVPVTVLRSERTIVARFAHCIIILNVKMIDATLGRSIIALTLAFMNRFLNIKI
jgi:hypothetical protein